MSSNTLVLNTLREFRKELSRPFWLERESGKPDVVAILDEFSIQSFSNYLNLWLIEPTRFELDLDRIKPSFLFVESAWNGNDGAWKYMVTSNSGPKEPLINLVTACRERGIPTVFWNKEDPPHFSDFVSTAKLFDVIFTSDAEMIPRYKEHAPNANVQLLQFAASPRLHKPGPQRLYEMKDVAFAGQYFAHKFPERRQQMDALFPAARKYGFDIFSRVLGGDERYQFPPEYAKNVVGSLPYLEMVEAYRDYKVFLNVNSVVDSNTMCARRVFELSACKTAVFGMESAAIRSVYDDTEMVLAEGSGEIAEKLRSLISDDDFREQVSLRAWRKTLSWHTYEHRVNKILASIGIESEPRNYLIVMNSDGLEESFIDEFIQSQNFDGPHNFRLVVDREVLDFSDVHAVFELSLNAHFKYDSFYTYDLVLAAEQQDSILVAKASEQESQERYVKNRPQYGWLMRYSVNENPGTRIFESPTETALSDSEVYLSDTQGVTPVAGKSK